MKFKIEILLILLLVTGCEKLVLKKESAVTIPFKNLEEGKYDINIYKVIYPNSFYKKEQFWNKFDILLKKLLLDKYKNEKELKLTLAFSRDFFKDYNSINEKGYREEEAYLYKMASSLTAKERKQLIKNSSKRIEFFRDTVQESLNLQIYTIKKILGEEENFDLEGLYTELDKEVELTKLKKIRQSIKLNLKELEIKILVTIEKPYVNLENDSKESYYLEKEIDFEEHFNFSKELTLYKEGLILKNLNKGDIEKFYNGDLKLKNRVIILENDKYRGYSIFEKDYIFYINGEDKVYEFENYEIEINILNVTLEELQNIDDKYTLKDIIGGN